MDYPKVLTEDETLDAALRGVSLARYGDGELSIALGGDCVSQVRDKRLAGDLRAILAADQPGLLVCIPNVFAKGTKEAWTKYGTRRYRDLYTRGLYGSSFITRPDSAPWIDRPDYWEKIKRLWTDRPTILVKGTERSLRAESLPGARRVVSIDCARRDAWADHADIERRIMVAHAELQRDTPAEKPIVLLCIGATSTVLAARLAAQGVHAVDAGHVGMFMRHAGAYALDLGDLISPEYRGQLLRLRETRKWGADGDKHADVVDAYAAALKAETVLDYGCGEQRLATALKGKRRVQGYDPGVAGREGKPKPCDLVVSTDVLEHVEPDRLNAVLRHIYDLTGKGAYMVIATRAANAVLPDGRNAHLIIEPAEWWAAKVESVGFRVDRNESNGKEVRLWLRK